MYFESMKRGNKDTMFTTLSQRNHNVVKRSQRCKTFYKVPKRSEVCLDWYLSVSLSMMQSFVRKENKADTSLFAFLMKKNCAALVMPFIISLL